MLKFKVVANLVTRIVCLGLTSALVGVYLPKVFSLNSELVFVAMPLAFGASILIIYAQAASLTKYVISNTEKN